MKRGSTPLLSLATLIVLLVPASAHQPFFKQKDFAANNPAQIQDPIISTAMYAKLETPNDVDYYSFNGSAGHSRGMKWLRYRKLIIRRYSYAWAMLACKTYSQKTCGGCS